MVASGLAVVLVMRCILPECFAVSMRASNACVGTALHNKSYDYGVSVPFVLQDLSTIKERDEQTLEELKHRHSYLQYKLETLK